MANGPFIASIAVDDADLICYVKLPDMISRTKLEVEVAKTNVNLCERSEANGLMIVNGAAINPCIHTIMPS